MNLNRVILVGRLTQDPVIKTTATGQAVCNFGLATNRIWTDQNNQKQEKTDFHNIVLWQKLAEIASQYLRKGNLVLIEGRIQTRSWQDSTGNKRYKTEIVVENMQLAPKTTSKASFQQQDQEQQKQEQQKQEQNIPIIEENTPPPQNPSPENKPENQEGDQEIDVRSIPF